jgi:hypothetical protein
METTEAVSRPSRPWRTRGATRFFRGVAPSRGPALCQTLSRLTRSNAPALDETGVPSRGFEANRPCRGRSSGARDPSRPDSRWNRWGPRRNVVPSSQAGNQSFRNGASPRDNTSILPGTIGPTSPSGHRRWTRGAGGSLVPRNARPALTQGPVTVVRFAIGVVAVHLPSTTRRSQTSDGPSPLATRTPLFRCQRASWSPRVPLRRKRDGRSPAALAGPVRGHTEVWSFHDLAVVTRPLAELYGPSEYRTVVSSRSSGFAAPPASLARGWTLACSLRRSPRPFDRPAMLLSWPCTLPQGPTTCIGSFGGPVDADRSLPERPPMGFFAPPALPSWRIHFPEPDPVGRARGGAAAFRPAARGRLTRGRKPRRPASPSTARQPTNRLS